MMFIKFKAGLIMLLLLFILSGCGNYDIHSVDNLQSVV